MTQSFHFPERLNCCYIYFHCSYLYNYYNYSPTILNKFSLLSKRRYCSGWKEAQRQGEDRVTLMKTLMYSRHNENRESNWNFYFFYHLTKHNTIQNCTRTTMNHMLVFLHGQHNMTMISTISTSPKQKLTY